MKEESSRNITIISEKNSDQADNIVQPHFEKTRANFIFNIFQHRYFMGGLYILAGLFLLFSLINILDTYILRIKVETAVVAAPIETMVAPMGGYISDVYVVPKQKVKKGDSLLKISNIDLERDLSLARVEVEELKLNITYYQNLLANEQQRMNIYKNIGTGRLESADSKVNISKENLQAVRHNLQRMNALHEKHYLSDAAFEMEVAKYKSAKENYRNALAQKSIEHHSLRAVQGGMYFTGTKLEGMKGNIHADLEAAENKVRLAEEKLKIYQHLNDQLILKAPFDGKVTEILKTAGNTTDNIKPIILIEHSATNKNIVAYLTQNEVAHIGDRKVKIYIPSSGKVYAGAITELDRTDGFVDMVKAQYRWRDAELDRSAKVTIAIEKSKRDFDREAFAGMPVIVYFSRKM